MKTIKNGFGGLAFLFSLTATYHHLLGNIEHAQWDLIGGLISASSSILIPSFFKSKEE